MDSTELAKKRASQKVGQAPSPVLDPKRDPVLRYRDRAATEGNLFIAVGSALAFVGLIDIGLLWYPLQLGTAGWEFSAVSRTFTSAPMTMVGLVLVAGGMVRRGTRPEVVRRFGAVFALLSFVLVAMGMLYALSALSVLAQASGDVTVVALKRAMFKNGAEIVVYPITFLTMAVILWQAVREDKDD